MRVDSSSSSSSGDSSSSSGDSSSSSGVWSRFWKWYEHKILGSVIMIAIIQFIQIPHMIWNADMMLEAGLVSRVHPVIDWLLYGVDLIEIVSIINVGMITYSLARQRAINKKNKTGKSIPKIDKCGVK